MSNEHDIEDDPLQAATLSESFANIPLHSAVDPVNDVHIPPVSSGSATAVDSNTDAAAAPSASAILEPLALSEEALEEERSKHIEWKDDYDKKLAEWRETAAVARAEVPLRHDKWEKIRETETEDDMLAELADAAREAPPSSSSSTSHVLAALADAKHDGEEDKDSGWESLGEASTMASSFVDARDLVSGETPGGHGAAALDAMFPPASLHSGPAAATTSSGDKAAAPTGGDSSAPGPSTNHVDVDTDTLSDPPSRLSSFPSLDFDESSSDKNGGSSSKRRRATITMSNSRGLGGATSGKGDKSSSRSRPSEHTNAAGHHHHNQQPQPASVTLAVFDSSLPTRTRVLALVSAVAINFCLPFINGVMLGFGEIFAKNVVNWIQIKRGKATPAVAGVGLSTGKR